MTFRRSWIALVETFRWVISEPSLFALAAAFSEGGRPLRQVFRQWQHPARAAGYWENYQLTAGRWRRSHRKRNRKRLAAHARRLKR
jgi:hypothetical protein